MPSPLYVDPDLGRIWLPRLDDTLSLPGRPVRRRLREIGVFVAKQHRDGRLIWASVTHNERVDAGAVRQDVQCFGAATAAVFTAVAVASATLVKAKTDLSLGSGVSGGTANEFTTLGLSRAAGSLGAYTAPGALGGQFSRVISKTFTASGNATAYGGGLFDSVTPAGSNLYVEDNFASTAVLVNGDTLTEQVTVSN